MGVINADTASMWQKLAGSFDKDRPSPGKMVRVTKGKREGVEGLVIAHQKSRFSDAYRYGSDAHLHMLDLRGRHGWTVRVKPSNGGLFWANADHVEVLP
jgi:hypothetical protein